MKYVTGLSAALIAVAAVVGCSHDADSMQGSPAMPQRGGAVAGNPGATTGPTRGFDANDPRQYHPMTDDMNRDHPANPDAVRKQSGQ